MFSIDTWKFLAGLGLFLYGISLMETVTRNLAGRSFKLFLRDHTNNLVKAVFGGTVLTGLIQSSSVVILMLMSFVGAGVISFRNALGVLLGSNLGTTVDSWFYATIGFKFNLQNYSLPIIAIAGIIMFFTQRRKKLYDSLYFIFSIGILLLGFGFMKEGAEQLVMKFNLAAYADYNLVFILFIGFILTVIIQSSSATIAIALTALHTHALTFPAAACVIIGSEAGTSIKFLLSSFQGSAEKRMLAWADLIFNLVTVIVSFSLLSWIILFIRNIVGIKDPLVGLVFFQSFINFISILIFLPFVNIFSRWLKKAFFNKKLRGDIAFNKDQPVIPELAAALLLEAGYDILRRVIYFHKKIFNTSVPENANGFFSGLRSFARVHGTTEREYSLIKETEGDILKYYTGLQKDDLVKTDYEKVNYSLTAIRQSIHAAKSVHDIQHNLQAFNASANDFLFRQYGLLQKEWKDFEVQLYVLMEDEDGAGLKAGFENSMKLAASRFQVHTGNIERSLADRELSEIEASTLLNVYQEILSSQKALLRALELLKLNVGKPGS
ncbi:MAG: Na/Pi symporter [Ferruginibacter sp.]